MLLSKLPEPYLDYLHISLRWTPETLSTLSQPLKVLFNEKLNELVTKPSPDHYKDHPHCKVKTQYNSIKDIHNSKICRYCRTSLFTPLNAEFRHKGSIYIGRSKNYTISIHFKGGWFQSAYWYDDLTSLAFTIKFVEQHIKQIMRQNGLPDQFEIKVSRIDIALNFYNKHIYNPSSQTFMNKAIKDKNYFYWQDRVTSINIGRKDSPHIYFRSYDKRFDKEKQKAKAIMRFNTDQFCKNEWSLLSHKLRALKLKNWGNWVDMLKNKSAFNQLVLHIRKNRDVTYYPNPEHIYNLIHVEKGFKKWKRPTNFKSYESIPWTPGPNTIGLIKNNIDDYTFQDMYKILFIISHNTDMIPQEMWQQMKDYWIDEGIVPPSFGYYLRKGNIPQIQKLIERKK